MLNSVDFLNPDECRIFTERVYALKDNFYQKNSDLYILGYPVYAFKIDENYSHNKSLHNELMKQNFSELLERLSATCEKILGGNCYFDDQIALPGFHIMRHQPKSSSKINFHLDFDLLFVKQFQIKDIDTNFPQMTLTVALNDNNSLESGLRYLNDQANINYKVFSRDLPEDYLYKNSKFKKYTLGKLNLQQGLGHSIDSTNNSELEIIDRITLQASILKTQSGFLIYW